MLGLKFKVYAGNHVYHIFYVCSTVFFMKLPGLYFARMDQSKYFVIPVHWHDLCL